MWGYAPARKRLLLVTTVIDEDKGERSIHEIALSTRAA